jgi:hypothetical protein
VVSQLLRKSGRVEKWGRGRGEEWEKERVGEGEKSSFFLTSVTSVTSVT